MGSCIGFNSISARVGRIRLPVDRFDDAVRHLVDNYLTNEPVNKFFGASIETESNNSLFSRGFRWDCWSQRTRRAHEKLYIYARNGAASAK